MAKPKEELKEREYFKNIVFLFEILNKFRTVGEVKLFLSDLLTDSELRMIKKRWHIACLLDSGLGVRKAARRTKASTQTVLRVKKRMVSGSGGLRLALARTKRTQRQEGKKSSEKKSSKWSYGIGE